MNKYKNKLIFIYIINFRYLERIVKTSSSIICSEVAISHISIALINKIILKTVIF